MENNIIYRGYRNTTLQDTEGKFQKREFVESYYTGDPCLYSGLFRLANALERRRFWNDKAKELLTNHQDTVVS